MYELENKGAESFMGSFAANMKRVALIDVNGGIKVWDTETGTFIANLIGHQADPRTGSIIVISAEFSDDGWGKTADRGL